jgi:cellulose biosynthesis protein BcsQ
VKVIGFHIAKGGVGKSSLAGNTAYLAAKRGLKTCLVDGDPQGNTSAWFLTSTIEHELGDVLQGNVTVSQTLVHLSGVFFLLPTAGLNGGLKKYSETALFHEPYVFEDLNEELRATGFDLVVYDLSPGLSMLERAILLSCKEVVSPMTPEYFSIDGLETFSLSIAEINKAYRRNVKHRRVVLNMVNRSFKLHNENRERIGSLDYELYIVPQDRAIPDSQAEHLSLQEYRPEARSLQELENLTTAMVGV